MNDNIQITATPIDGFIKNFPFQNIRDSQSYVLNEIGTAFSSGYIHILLEAPTGFGKSPVAIAVALTLGSSFICTSTKDLQTQYSRDFPVVKIAKGKNNFSCAVKEDFIKNSTYECGSCVSNNVNECHHTNVDYGPCMSDKNFEGSGCKYRTFLNDYKIRNKGTREEEVFIDNDIKSYHENEYSQWLHLKNLKDQITAWRPCEYYHQLYTALTSSHSILNYPMFFGLLAKRESLPSRDLLILDEAHLLETEIVKFREISISKRRWKKYIPDFKMADYGYNDIESWISFLVDLEARMNDLIGNISEELAVEAITVTKKLRQVIDNIRLNPKNWIVSEIKKEDNEVIRVELKPHNTSQYWTAVFEKCKKALMMSATILDRKTFCTSLGLVPDEVKFIQVGSDFPIQNRPIYSMNIAYLNSNNLKLEDIQIKIVKAIDNLMTLHKKDKGIIHTTSYKQMDFIKENISLTNKCRLLNTDPNIPREEVIEGHVNSTKPTVLISPSLYLGLDLKDDLSRFQIITKVPYPDLGDRWINKKKEISRQWYTWQTALRLVQGYGRSIRSKEDWAKTYVLDSGFVNFVRKNKNILPDWFTQAIRLI